PADHLRPLLADAGGARPGEGHPGGRPLRGHAGPGRRLGGGGVSGRASVVALPGSRSPRERVLGVPPAAQTRLMLAEVRLTVWGLTGVSRTRPMKERDWLACTEPTPLLRHLRNSGTPRRNLRLLACAAARQGLRGLLTDDRAWEAIQARERYEDNLLS